MSISKEQERGKYALSYQQVVKPEQTYWQRQPSAEVGKQKIIYTCSLLIRVHTYSIYFILVYTIRVFYDAKCGSYLIAAIGHKK